uniref:prenylated Rab acceptor protein 1-like isoform X2 n=1 Tax=Styela clava TaxID=7725 RepID=UPI00193964BE|nr:prenylated Rab acceptor protein 1-like isoform X2 [Styela clava]
MSTTEEVTGNISLSTKMISLNSPAAKEWLNHRRQSVRPWSDFVNTKNFNTPKGVKGWSARAVKNVEHYQTNYLFVFIGLIIYCIVTSPLMLIAIAVFLGACYLIHIKNEQQKIKVIGHELSYAHQYGIAAALSFPLFFIAGAGSAVFWVLGVSFFLVALHASFHISPEEAAKPEEPFMETV